VARIRDRPLCEGDLDPDPLTLLRRWLEDARERGEFTEAVALATATRDGRPSVRMVLMKALDSDGVTFFTNYGSRKGVELDENPRAALLFHWPELGRQVRIEGPVERGERVESERYAHSRTRESQLSALASPQSRPVPSREWLEERVAELDREHQDGELPVSEEWGGYRLVPEVWEFWQHRPSRLHDRFRYARARSEAHDVWTIDRLAP